VFFEPLLIIVPAILASTIGVVIAAFRGLTQGDGHVQRLDRQVALHATADGPANDPARMQIQNGSQVQPTLAGPYIRDVARPFLVRRGCGEVPIQQIGSHRQGVIAVGGHLVFPGSDYDDAVLHSWAKLMGA
jgi:hypothetical protein